MSRSPVVRVLRRIAGGNPGADIPLPTRRLFLAGTTSLVLRPLTRAAGVPRIAIVGAGLAGLTCAYRLRQKGIASEVYEASTRAGGRCLTVRDRFEGDQTAEAGGASIDPHHKAIRALCEELQLELVNLDDADPPDTNPVYHFDGKPYAYSRAVEDLKRIYPAIQRDASGAQWPVTHDRYTRRAYELDHMRMQNWIRQNVPGGGGSLLGRLLETAVSLEFGEDASRLSALNLISLLAVASPGELWTGSSWLRGGNDRIVTRLASGLAPAIRYGHELRAIEQNRDGTYALMFRTDRKDLRTVADRVVMAVPFPVLRRVDHARAGFAALKLRAIRELGMGTNSKLHLQFASRHWTASGCNGMVYSDPGYLAMHETAAQSGRQGILMYFSGGREARSGPTSPDQALERLQLRISGTKREWNGRSHTMHWPSSPWSRGSYSMWKVGQHTAFAGIEGQAEGGCHFCGEHTSLESQGYLDGAVESGERAAREVLAALG